MDAGIFKKFLIRRKFNIIFGRTGGKNGDVEKSNKRNTDWKCMDRRKSSGSDPVYDKYKDRGCGGDSCPDIGIGGSRMRHYPLRCAYDGGGGSTHRDKKKNSYSAADIHFDYRLAIAAIEHGADKIRINPGNIGDVSRVREVVEKAKEYNVPIRVGVNSGSLEKHLVEKYGGVTAEGIVESALDKVRMIEEMGYDNLVVSIKSSDVMMCVKAHELIAEQCPYPLHVGITESGTILSGNIKSSVGLGIILYEGIGDTIRVSLTGDPLEEIKSAKLILKTLGLRKGGIEVVSCPTCGRTKIDLIGLANQVENMVADIPLDIKVAVMGCVVNGPGEAKEADIGIAGGIGEGLLIKKGEIVKKVKEEELLDTLRNELLNWEK